MRRFFIHARDGNVAMIFALCLIPLLILMGGAIDLSRQRGTEVGAQNAIDAALLAVAHEAFNLDDKELQSKGREWFDTHLINDNLDIQSFTIVRTDKQITAEVVGTIDTTFLGLMGLNKLTVKRRATVRYGLQKIEVALVLDTTGSMDGVVASTQTCNRRGCTGGQTKLAVLKEAATKMLNGLESASADSGLLDVAIVPFASYVNVGPENINAKWIDTDSDSPVAADNLVEGLNRFDLYEHLGYEWKGCVQVRPHPYDVRDTRPQTSKPETLFVPVFHPDEPDTSGPGETYPNNYVDDVTHPFGGLPVDVGGPLGSDELLLLVQNPEKYGVPAGALLLNPDVTLTLPDGTVLGRDDCPEDYDKDNGYGNNDCPDPLNPAEWTTVTIHPNYTYFSDVDSTIGPDYNCEMRPITPLTDDWDTLRSEISGLAASGSTNITEGVMWGWRVLSPGLPFKEGDAYAKDTRKILILLSDGNNMIVRRDGKAGESDFSAYGYLANERLDGTDEDSSQAEILDAMDDLTLEACTNIKAKGIRIITIRLDLTDARSEKVLSSCASSPEDFVDVQNTAELVTAFEKITDDITQLYLSE